MEQTYKYVITHMEERIFSFLLHNNKAVEIHCDEISEDSQLGNIYVGKIKNIAKNIEAAFVEISPGEVCYVPLEDMKYPVYTKKGSSKKPQAGDELLIQISRDKIKSKFAAGTTNIELHGKYVLLTAGKPQLSVSSKVSKEEKERLQVILKDYAEHRNHKNKVSDESEAAIVSSESRDTAEIQSTPIGWLMRTNAATADDAVLTAEMNRLLNQYHTIVEQAKYRTCFSCLHRSPSSYLMRLSNLYDRDSIQILTDETDLYEEIQNYLKMYQPEDAEKATLYQDELLPLKKLYSLENQLSEALKEKVWLKSGGYLVIQPTEALTVVDVNTGKYEGGKKKSAAMLKINLEAATETARQIRLRNLSGIIICDFINMDSKEDEKVLLDQLGTLLRKDPIPTNLVDMTKLSLVEITRKKREKPLYEAVRRVQM